MIWFVRTRGLSRWFSSTPEVLQDRGARLEHLALVVMVDLEQAVGALDDLHGRLNARRLQRGVRDLVDRDTRRDLDPERRLVRHGQEAARSLTDERRLLRLKRVEETVRTQYSGSHP